VEHVSIELPIPSGVLEDLARKVAEHVAAQAAPEPSRWLNVESAADYLDTTPEAVRGLVKREDENGFPVHRRGATRRTARTRLLSFGRTERAYAAFLTYRSRPWEACDICGKGCGRPTI
jgi:hypothetical protein